jgi:Ferritin-like domain
MRRRTFLATGTAGALALAGCGGDDDEPEDDPGRLPGAPDDAAVVAYLLRLERLHHDLYRRALGTPLFTGESATLLESFAAQEVEHISVLEELLRRTRGREERPARLRVALTDRESYLATAYRLENLTAAAYLGQLGRIRDSAVLEELLSIHTIEARHAVGVGALIGKTATPDGALSLAANMATVERVLGELAA